MIIKEHYINGNPIEFRTAFFSEDEKYRYLLEIVWDPSRPILTTIGLNPSKATHLVNDNTISKCIKFARDRGFGGYRMLNAFAYRSTKPAVLFSDPDPVGPENTIEFFRRWRTETTVACWGATMRSKLWKYRYWGHEIAEALPGLLCFKYTSKGRDPEHPLYLPLHSDLNLVQFSYE